MATWMACARCSDLMRKTDQSLPEGRAVCRKCRQQQPEPYGRLQRECPACGKLFLPNDHQREGRVQQTCSRSCGQLVRYGVTVHAGVTAQERKREANRRKNIKRRGADITSEPYTLTEIAERDGFRCGLCRRKVNMRLSGMHPKGPTIDHIIPLSVSRDDTRQECSAGPPVVQYG